MRTRAAGVEAVTARLPGRPESLSQQQVLGTFTVRRSTPGTMTVRGRATEITAAVYAAVVTSVLVTSDVGPLITPQVRTLAFLGVVIGLFGILLVLQELRPLLRGGR